MQNLILLLNWKYSKLSGFGRLFSLSLNKNVRFHEFQVRHYTWDLSVCVCVNREVLEHCQIMIQQLLSALNERKLGKKSLFSRVNKLTVLISMEKSRRQIQINYQQFIRLSVPIIVLFSFDKLRTWGFFICTSVQYPDSTLWILFLCMWQNHNFLND